MLGGIRGCLGSILCLKRLKLSCNVDECKPLTAGFSGAELFNLVNIAAVQAAVQEVGP